MDVIMPKMGESINEGTIIKWLKKKGDFVKRDEIILEISTDKVDTEIPSPAEGILSEINYKEGDTVEVGVTLAVIIEGADKASAAKSENPIAVPEQQAIENNKPLEKVVSPEPIAQPITQVNSTASNDELIDIVMPKMGESVMEGTIIKWHKKVGDNIKKDETIYEISTDKVDTEVPSPADGVLAEVLVAEQETVDVGTIVAKLSINESLNIPKKTTPQVPSDKLNQSKPSVVENILPTSMHDNFAESKLVRDDATKLESESTSFLSPLVLNIAQKEKVKFEELARIKGTGLAGRITKNDILSYVENRNQLKSTPAVKEEKKPLISNSAIDVSNSNFNYDSIKSAYNSNDTELIPMDN
ncbi:MAG TPA: biotin/lipoyl-containing protein, partial [Ignavibacteriaceae bacterium]|nr:biotin/lipoyl-containing protein [Ignavibacteriaceae bacterium]